MWHGWLGWLSQGNIKWKHIFDIGNIIKLVDFVDFMNYDISQRYAGDIDVMFYMVELVDFPREMAR